MRIDQNGITYVGEDMDWRDQSVTRPNMLREVGGNDRVGIFTGSPTQTLSVQGTAGKTGGGSWATFFHRRAFFITGLDQVLSTGFNS